MLLIKQRSRPTGIIKRIFDFVLALIGVIVLLPVFLVIILCIELEEPGSSFIYSQVRVGKNGKHFKMYKFRSMMVNADQFVDQLRSQHNVDSVMFKLKADPRVTKVGKFIRKHSLDELPQLFNVLIGTMSLVGPRPALPEEVAQYQEKDKIRLDVLPGCTGIWQVSGRSNVSFDEMVSMDRYYVNHQSFWLDLSVITKTAKVIIFPNAAY